MKINQRGQQMHPNGGVWSNKSSPAQHHPWRSTLHGERANKFNFAGGPLGANTVRFVRRVVGHMHWWGQHTMRSKSGLPQWCLFTMLNDLGHRSPKDGSAPQGWRHAGHAQTVVAPARHTISGAHGEPTKSVGQQPFILRLHHHPLRRTLSTPSETQSTIASGPFKHIRQTVHTQALKLGASPRSNSVRMNRFRAVIQNHHKRLAG